MKKIVVWFGLLAALALITGCNPSSDSPGANDSYSRCLYMTDTYSGKVFTYDPVSRSPSAMSVASTGQNSTGEIAFYKGIGYACVGYGTNAGVYRFDPSASNPAFSKIGSAITAQYIAFASSSKAYVTTYGSGLYSFDPSASAPSFALVSGTDRMTLQEIIVGSDDLIYVADNGNGAVLRINPADDSIVSISTSALGTTGIVSGTYGGSAGVFVANTGGYGANPAGYGANPAGSIDFIAGNETKATTIANALPGGGAIYPGRLVQLSNGNLVATGYGHSYLVDLSGPSAAISELSSSSGLSFGSLDIAYKDGLVYIPVTITTNYIIYQNYLYVLGEDGSMQSYSPVSVMGSSESITNIAFYED